jgi:hypothetical protein
VTSLLFVSDIHGNNKMSVCPPTVNLENGGTYHCSPNQRWLYERWLEVAEKFKEESKNDQTVLLLNGEIVECDAKNRGAFEQICHTDAETLRLGADLIDPLAQSADSLYVMRGTFAHSGKAAKLDEAIGEDFDAVKSPEGTYSWYHLNLLVDDIKIELAHHGSMGGRPWTQRNAANYLAADVLMTYAVNGEQPPDLTIRGHLHRWADSYDNYPTRAIFLPGFTFFGPFIHRLGKGHNVPEIGAMIVRTDGGKYEVEKLKFEIGGRKWWTLQNTPQVPMTSSENLEKSTKRHWWQRQT